MYESSAAGRYVRRCPPPRDERGIGPFPRQFLEGRKGREAYFEDQGEGRSKLEALNWGLLEQLLNRLISPLGGFRPSQP